MLCELGIRAGSPRGTSTSSNDHRRVGTDEATGIDDRTADTDHHQSSRTGRNPDASNSDQPRSNPYGPSAAGESQYTDGAVSDIAGDSDAKWNSDRNNSVRYSSGRSCAIHAFSAGRANFEFRGNAVESWDESAGKRRKFYGGK